MNDRVVRSSSMCGNPTGKDRNQMEMDPSGRFQKFYDILHVRDKVIWYKAYDTKSGLEVTWHEVFIGYPDEQKKTKLFQSCELIKKLQCPSLLSLIHYWMSSDHKKLCYITESASSNSIIDQIGKGLPEVRPKAIYQWFLPVLQTLQYLHTQNPPIIHRRLNINSIFVKPSSKTVKIVPPLVVPFELRKDKNSLLIQPTSPPELLNQDCGTYSDIWSFGLAILQAYTKVEPYNECHTTLKLLEKISSFTPPDSLSLVNDPLARDLIKVCLQPPLKRPSASQLLLHPFFRQDFEPKQSSTPSEEDDGLVVIFSGKNTRSNQAVPAINEEQNSPIDLNSSGRISISTPFFKANGNGNNP